MDNEYIRNIFIVIMVIGLIIAGCVYVGKEYYESHTTIITVEKMYIDHSGDESYYMLATTDGRVFECDNSFWKGQFAIDKEWAYIEVNGTYTVKYFGWDIQKWYGDWYLTIYDFEEIP